MNAGFSSAEIDRFRALVEERVGLRFDEDKLAVLADALRDRMGATRVPTVESYLERLRPGADDAELGALAELLTVGETFFFRDENQIRALVDVAVPERAEVRREARRLSIFSAGCASGEEPYSIAMALTGARAIEGYEIDILAIDVNPAAIARARRAGYSRWSLRALDEEQVLRWFEAKGRELTLLPEIRDKVRFEVRNLADERAAFPSGAFDIVFCRNVLMYFAPRVAERVVSRLSRALASGGYLFLGHAETLRGLSNDFDLCHTHGTFYYRKKAGTRSREAAPSTSVPRAAAADEPTAPAWFDVIVRAAARIDSLAEERRDAAADEKPLRESDAAEPSVERALAEVMRAVREERFAEAEAMLDALEESERNDPRMLLIRALLLPNAGRQEEAERACERLLLLDGRCAGAHYLRALCREQAGDPSGAVRHGEHAARIDPGFAMARLHLGLLHRRLGDADSARRELERALVLLDREDEARLLLFGGGFSRGALVELCRSELATLEAGR